MWTKINEVKGYSIWQHSTLGVYQATKAGEVPTTDSGYYSLNALLALKELPVPRP